MIEANESVRLRRLDQHIRALMTARRWLKKEMKLRAATPKQATTK
jgi:hypothetical protein